MQIPKKQIGENKIMNPIILKIDSSPIHCSIDSKGGSLKSVKRTGDFFASIQELLNPTQKRAFHKPTKSVQTGPALIKKYKFYIETLKKELLAKGKPLDKISLNTKDILVLKKFLSQCGFSPKEVESLLQRLTENKRDGEINLAQFFDKLEESEHPGKKSVQSVALDISAIPHLESLLRDFGLSPKELDHAFSYARLESGKLDLKKFVIKLKEISTQIEQREPEQNQLTMDRDVVLQVLKKLEGTEILMPDKEIGDRISIKDLITTLEQMTGGPGKEGHLPGDVKTAIDQIVERTAVPAERDGSASSLLVSKLRLTALYPNEKKGEKGKTIEKMNFVSILDKKDGTVEKDNALLFSGNKDKTAEKENVLTLLKKNSAVSTENGQKMAKGTPPFKNDELFSKSYVPPDIVNSTSSHMINNAKQQSKIGRDSLPAYLVNQVGRQISRTILRGERGIKLQLHPPELGGMKIEMDIKDNALKLGMIIESSSVKEILLSNAHELRQALVEQGIKLEKLDIHINYNSGQTLTNSKESPKQNQRGAKRTISMPSIEENGSEQSPTMHRVMLRGDRLLDLTA